MFEVLKLLPFEGAFLDEQNVILLMALHLKILRHSPSFLRSYMLIVVQTEEEEESVWASALSCLLYFVCDRGRIWRNRLQGLDIRVRTDFLLSCTLQCCLAAEL